MGISIETVQSLGIYLLPGVALLVPYWVIWPVKRGFIDVLCAMAIVPIGLHGFADIVGSLITPFFGSSLMFGAWGPGALALCLSIGGFCFGAWYGYSCSQHGPDFYPSDRFPIR